MHLRVVGDSLMIGLFGLAGIKGREVTTAEETRQAIDGYLADPEVGAVLVTSSAAARLGAGFKSYLQLRKLPLVLRIPDRENREGSAAEIREYLQKSLGIRL